MLPHCPRLHPRPLPPNPLLPPPSPPPGICLLTSHQVLPTRSNRYCSRRMLVRFAYPQPKPACQSPSTCSHHPPPPHCLSTHCTLTLLRSFLLSSLIFLNVCCREDKPATRDTSRGRLQPATVIKSQHRSPGSVYPTSTLTLPSQLRRYRILSAQQYVVPLSDSSLRVTGVEKRPHCAQKNTVAD